MKNDNIYTMTIKMAKGGTEHIDENGKSSSSTAGHMWYTLSENGEQTDSYGFGPDNYGITDVFGMYTDGHVIKRDDEAYQATYATYEVRITQEEYDKLVDFGINDNLEQNGFKDYYKVATNSCVDYVWKAMEFAGVNPDKFDGDVWPKNNRDDVNEKLYKALYGTEIPKEEQALEKTATDGSFTAIYGSKGVDDITSTKQTEVVYTGAGDDTLKGTAGHTDRLRGGVGEDTYKVQEGDRIKDTDNKGKIYFDATLLSGTKHRVSKDTYEDKMFTYALNENNLIIAQKEDASKSITVEDWNDNKEALGIILSDEKTAEYQVDPVNSSMSLLPDDVAIPNAQIAEFDSNEDTQTQENEKGAFLMENDILLSPEGYVIDEYAEEINNTKTNEDDYGMEM